MLTLVKPLIIKILNSKLVILIEYQNIKIFLQNVTLQKVWNTCPGHVINDLKVEETETFYENELQKKI